MKTLISYLTHLLKWLNTINWEYKYHKLRIPIASEDVKQQKIPLIADGNRNGKKTSFQTLIKLGIVTPNGATI